MVKIILLISSLLLIACRNPEQTPELPAYTGPVREYFAVLDQVADDGWQSFINIFVSEDDLVSRIHFDGVTPLASSTRRNVSQTTAYFEHFGYHFYEQTDFLSQQLIGVHITELVSLIASAKVDYLIDFDPTVFADLARLALSAGPVVRGPYLDGAYQAFAEVDDDGYHYFVNMYILMGNIVAVHFNAVNNEGVLKYDQILDVDGGLFAIGMQEQFEYFAQVLIATQNPMAITFDEDGFATAISALHIPVEPLINLVTLALAAGPTIE